MAANDVRMRKKMMGRHHAVTFIVTVILIIVHCNHIGVTSCWEWSDFSDDHVMNESSVSNEIPLTEEEFEAAFQGMCHLSYITHIRQNLIPG